MCAKNKRIGNIPALKKNRVNTKLRDLSHEKGLYIGMCKFVKKSIYQCIKITNIYTKKLSAIIISMFYTNLNDTIIQYRYYLRIPIFTMKYEYDYGCLFQH